MSLLVMNSLYTMTVPIMVRRKNIHAVFCENNYFPKGKFKLSNSLFHSECTLLFFNTFDFYYQFVCRALSVGRTVCNEDKCCVVTDADIVVVPLRFFTWLVYVCTYCLPIATLNQNK